MSWGLVLSGGVACGIANGGVLETLEASNLKPDYIAGSSMGAIIGALYAFGVPIETIHTLSLELSPLSLATFSSTPFKQGLHSGFLHQAIRKKLSPLIDGATIGDCKIPFVCIAGRVKEPLEWQRILKEGFIDYAAERIEKEVFASDVSLLDAITASSAMPVIFEPAKIHGKEYIDLLNFGAIPARTLRDMYQPDIVIGTNTNPDYGDLITYLPKGWREFLAEGNKSLEESKAACDLLIEPAMPYASYRFDKADAFWAAGKSAAEDKIQKIELMLH